MKTTLTKFGILCKQRRAETCRSLAMMAEAIGVDAEYVSAIEHGEVPTTEAYVENVAEYFKLRYEYLLPYAFPERFLQKQDVIEKQISMAPTTDTVISLDDYRPK